jgi:hypothetical protein
MAGGVIVFAAMAAYCNSFSTPFMLDDSLAIATNPSIRHWVSALSPPARSTAGGRPLINLTFAVNYAMGGMNVRGYHVLNLLIHSLAGLVLFGIVRRTLLRPAVAGLPPSPRLWRTSHRAGPSAPIPRFAEAATPLALAVAVIWTVHPLQTEAVTYISQRAESLMGLFYLLALYCFIRGADERRRDPELGSQKPEASIQKQSDLRPPASLLWPLASVFCCLLGAMSKEIIVTAPVMVFLYDRIFVAGSFAQAWRLHWRYYLGLTCTWLLLAVLMTSLRQHGVGFGYGVTWWSYGLTSCRSVVLYLKLAVWPHPLVFDYGTHVVRHVAEAAPYALVLMALFATVLITLLRRPAIGFAGIWFFLILAPVSSVVPVAGQPMAEHRV